MNKNDVILLNKLNDRINDIIISFNIFVNNIDKLDDGNELTKIKKEVKYFSNMCNKLDEINSNCSFVNKNMMNIINVKILNMRSNKVNLCKLLDYNDNIKILYLNIEKGKLKIPNYLSKEASKCLLKMLNRNPNKRPRLE